MLSAMGDEAAASFDASAFLRTAPNRAGVYRMLDRRGQVLYVGKARNLRRRLASWLRGGPRDAKARALLSHTASVEVTVTHTETEALLLENNLIKEHRPRYNILLRDDKSYPWIHLTAAGEGGGGGASFPRFVFHRGARRGGGRYFGPYSSAGAVRQTLGSIHRLFRIRQCTDAFFRNRSRPCLQYQIDRCSAPCVGLIDEAGYAEDVRHAAMFLEGRSEAMIEELVERMEAASRRLEFELAARCRDRIGGLRRIQERQYVDGAKGDIDVVAVCCREGLAAVQVLEIRNGQSLGSHTRLPANVRGAGEEEVLEAFLGQYYLSRERPIPKRIVLDREPPSLGSLAEALSRRGGRKVRIGMARRGHRVRWVRMARENAELALQRQLLDRSTLSGRRAALGEALGLAGPPARIECFDVSHTDGEAAVASCVVFGPEGPLKSDYRRFNIRGVEPGDDYAAMHQALARRFGVAPRAAGGEGAGAAGAGAAGAEAGGETERGGREAGEGGAPPLPDLLLIDGGRGQLERALAVLSELAADEVAVAAVAKGASRKPGLESIYLPGRASPLALPEESPALHLVQQVRDEAHRFAITGHRSQRAKRRRTSTLEALPGVGPVLRQRLLSEFGGLAGVRRAGVEDLARIRGVSQRRALEIYDALREGA